MDAFLLMIVALLLFGSELLYFRIAGKYNIIDKPNQRSSHDYITIRGGGIVVPLAALWYAVFIHQVHWAMIAGVVLISVVSFWDDVDSLPNKVRLLVHAIAVTLLLYTVNAFQQWNPLFIFLAYVVIVGTINAYNFMDGINGITGIYSLVAFISLWQVNDRVTYFTDDRWILYPGIACIVFLFFNYRNRARCFAGDVGSISLGFWVIGLILMLVVQTGDFSFLLFLSVYGVDTISTIIHRLLLRQNIFEAHRLHLYQILVNNKRMSHRLVAFLYGITQFIINIWVISSTSSFWIELTMVCIPLSMIYIFLKWRLMAAKTSLG